MTKPQVDKKLNDIFSDFYSYNSEEEHISMPVGRAKRAIKALFATHTQQVREELIKELKEKQGEQN